jgi:hypothetical protein
VGNDKRRMCSRHEAATDDEILREKIKWIRSLPPVVQKLMLRFPPSAVVRAKKGQRLMCPAPGELGTIHSYMEDDRGASIIVNVVGNSAMGSCEPEWLEIVRIAGDLDGAFVKACLEQPS